MWSHGLKLCSTGCWTRLTPRAGMSTVKPIKMAFNVFESPNTDKSARPLIIMHGLFGSKQNWRGIGRALESKLKRRIFAVDARNHGDSPHDSEHHSVHMAADVLEFMRNEGITKADVMGHSMGGRSMMYFALKYPHAVDKCIVVDVSPIAIPENFSTMDRILAAMQKISVPSNLSPAEGRKLVDKQIKDAVGAKDTVDFIMMNLRKRPSGEFYWAVNVDVLRTAMQNVSDYESHISNLAPFQGPAMFLCGNQSDYVDPNDWPDIQKIFPNSEIHWLDAGHLVHFDQPAQFIDLVVSFLSKS